jgi:hypothetical protein
MNTNVKEIVLALHSLRPDVAQFVFFDSIFPRQMIKVRKAIIEYKKLNPDTQEIDFILYSPGGLADDAYRIIRNLRKNFKTVNVIVPFWAKSAATLLSLGANKIIVDEFGEFGPLDAQVGKPRADSPEYDRESALNDEHSVNVIENRFKILYEQMYIRLFEHKQINIEKNVLSDQLLNNLPKFYSPLLSQIDPYKLGEKKRKLDIGAQYAKRILMQFGEPKDRSLMRELVDYLIHECPDHGYVIDKDVLENFVDNIYSSDTFGEEYQQKLQELSMYLIEEDDDDFIGFVEPDVIEEKDIPESDLAVTETGEIIVENNTDTSNGAYTP